MDSEGTLVTYRILNRSETDVVFQTAQAIEIVVTPGSIIDLYSFEVDDSPSFQEISQPERLDVSINQSCSIDKIHLEHIKSEIKVFREPDAIETKELKVGAFPINNKVQKKTIKTRKKKVISKKSNKRKEVRPRIIKSKKV